ncbi:MAG: 4Fe-4S dicluster domain-containing protein, partial [Planctomycetota bacterium]|nr:4Fe-4S dicluster domain-containing protein [Planctomycetota bacterium]
MKRIFIDRDKCQGCLGCAVACMAEHNPAGKSVYDLDMASRENVIHNNVLLDAAAKPTPVFCRHCDDPDCVRACMSGAMTKDPATGRVAHDAERCASCYMCVMSCPYGVLKVDMATRRTIRKCDYCGDRESPRCV